MADATFTLRLNFGTVQGWEEPGKIVPPYTTLATLFERATGEPPFAIPASWLAVKDQLDLSTRFNASGNNDIVGGNSGSPLLNAKGEVVGPGLGQVHRPLLQRRAEPGTLGGQLHVG